MHFTALRVNGSPFGLLLPVSLLACFRSRQLMVSATVMVYPASLPTSLTLLCSDALLTDIAACDPVVKNLRPDFFYPPTSLDRFCTADCASGLTTWLSSVRAECGNQTVEVDLQVQAAAVYLPGSLQYSFESACLKDESGRYCGPVVALAAAFSDPGASYFNYISNVTDQDVQPDNCDTCLAERLRRRASSPYFDGPQVASESLYESMTSSCGITGRPVATSTIDYFMSTPTPAAAEACPGSKYTVQQLDDCYTISRSQSVGTAWLLSDNQLGAYCTDFPVAGTELCIANTCTTITIGTNATCEAIAGAVNITEAQLHAWNPVLDYGCSNIGKLTGSEVCVDAPGRKFVPPTNTGALPPMAPTAPATIPTDVAEGSGVKPCGRYYTVQPGDYCNLLTVKFGITLDDFLLLNTAVYENCTNLFALESYCVQAVGDINTYSGRPGFESVTLDPSATFTGTPFTNLATATAEPYARLYTPLPIAEGTRDDCVHYFHGDEYQFDLSGTSLASNCILAVTVYNADVEAFASWNSGLGDDLSSPSCTFQTGVRYCGSWSLQQAVTTDIEVAPTGTLPPNSTGTGLTPPGPTMSGEPADCNQWAVVTEGVSCSDMASAAGLTLDQFLAWNPAVSSDCQTNYWLDEAYCIGVAGTAPVTSTSNTSTSSTRPTPPAPTMSGEPADCNGWAVVTDGLSCTDMAAAASISLAQFLAWNPAVSSDCTTNYWLGEAYCVSTESDSGGGTPTTAAPTTTATNATPPGPTMGGEPANCSKWALVTDGLSCTDMAAANGISLNQFLSWNPAVSDDCLTNYWLGEAYCVGV